MGKNKEKRVKIATVAYLVLSLVVLVFVASLVAVYALPRSIGAVKWAVEKSPYPAVILDYRYGFSFKELADNMTSIRRFYENQDFSRVGLRVDFTTEDGQKRVKVREREVLNKMIEDKAIQIIANQKNIYITREMASQGVTRKLEEYGSSAQVTENLNRLYGWTLDDFESKVVIPSLYQEKLEAVFEEEVQPSEHAKAKIDEAQKMLRNGTSFADVAKKYSEGQTAKDGGDLGWFSLEDLAPELQKPVSLQRVGIPGDIIESDLGFHITLIEEMKKGDNGKQLYHLRQIFARKATFSEWLAEKMKDIPIFVLLPEYTWNKDTSRLEFKSEDMKSFEEELYRNPNGDAMFLF